MTNPMINSSLWKLESCIYMNIYIKCCTESCRKSTLTFLKNQKVQKYHLYVPSPCLHENTAGEAVTGPNSRSPLFFFRKKTGRYFRHIHYTDKTLFDSKRKASTAFPKIATPVWLNVLRSSVWANLLLFEYIHLYNSHAVRLLQEI